MRPSRPVMTSPMWCSPRSPNDGRNRDSSKPLRYCSTSLEPADRSPAGAFSRPYTAAASRRRRGPLVVLAPGRHERVRDVRRVDRPVADVHERRRVLVDLAVQPQPVDGFRTPPHTCAGRVTSPSSRKVMCVPQEPRGPVVQVGPQPVQPDPALGEPGRSTSAGRSSASRTPAVGTAGAGRRTSKSSASYTGFRWTIITRCPGASRCPGSSRVILGRMRSRKTSRGIRCFAAKPSATV